MFSNFSEIVSWINNAMAWYVLALFCVVGLAQGFAGCLTRVPSSQALKAFGIIQIPIIVLYLISTAWQWPISDPIGIRSILAQLLLTIEAMVVHTFALTMTNLWMQFKKPVTAA